MSPPSLGDMVLGVAAAMLGCLGAAAAVRAAHASLNWFAWVCALGCAAFVAGVAGQRVFPSAAAIRRLGATAAASSAPGPWEAGVSLPLIPLRMTPVALGGLLLAAIGLSLVLLFERAPAPHRGVRPSPAPLDHDDSV